jgi:hypothetical protein
MRNTTKWCELLIGCSVWTIESGCMSQVASPVLREVVSLVDGYSWVCDCRKNKKDVFVFLSLVIKKKAAVIFYTPVICSCRLTNNESSLPFFLGNLTLGCRMDGHRHFFSFLSIQFDIVNILVHPYILCNIKYIFTSSKLHVSSSWRQLQLILKIWGISPAFTL